MLKSIFDEYDADKSGKIGIAEFRRGLKADSQKHGGTGVIAVADNLFGALDKDGDGQIDFSELLKNVYPLASDANLKAMHEWACPPEVEQEVVKPQMPTETLEEYRAIFKLYDKARAVPARARRGPCAIEAIH